jgi:hypothetical protein
MSAVCLMLTGSLASGPLAGCSGLTPGTYSQDAAAISAASMLRHRDGLASRVRSGFAKLSHVAAAEHEPQDHDGAEGLAPARALPPAVPPVELAMCSQQLEPSLARVCCPSQRSEDDVDHDRDGLLDRCEDALAERFAPIFYHSSDDKNYPTSVDTFLAKTRLVFFDDGCRPDLRVPIVTAPTQEQLIGHLYEGGCGARDIVRSDGTVSAKKHRGFLLEDVAPADRRGSLDTRDWTTYVHVYPSRGGQVTLQYWHFWAYNDAMNNHGGDFEGVHLVVDGKLRPVRVRLPGHWGNLKDMSPEQFVFEGNHIRVFIEGGGHAPRESGLGITARGCASAGPCSIRLDNRRTYVREETRPGGKVWWFDGRVTEPGRLLNVGSKSAPLNGQVFLQYSGLWGSPGLFFWSSGYWGPAFNEARKGRDGFRSAWCLDRVGPNVYEECYPRATTR